MPSITDSNWVYTNDYTNEIHLHVCVHSYVCMSEWLYIFAHVHLEARGCVSSITDSLTEPGVLNTGWSASPRDSPISVVFMMILQEVSLLQLALLLQSLCLVTRHFTNLTITTGLWDLLLGMEHKSLSLAAIWTHFTIEFMTIIVLTNSMSTWHMLGSLERKVIQLRKCLYKIQLQASR